MIMLNIEVKEGFDAAGETIEVVEIHSDILLVVGSLPLLSDVIELIERLDVESVIHALHDFQMHKLIVALVKIVALLVRELHHVVGFIVGILPQFLDFIKLHRQPRVKLCKFVGFVYVFVNLLESSIYLSSITLPVLAIDGFARSSRGAIPGPCCRLCSSNISIFCKSQSCAWK